MTPSQQRSLAEKLSAEAQAKVKGENAKHTPGPWQLAQDGSIGSIETVSGQVPIGHSFQTRPTRRPEDHIERIANARLMAAAPDLLKWLQFAAKVLRPTCGHTWQFEQIEQAIHKATGEAP